jgi:hypothetical protein
MNIEIGFYINISLDMNHRLLYICTKEPEISHITIKNTAWWEKWFTWISTLRTQKELSHEEGIFTGVGNFSVLVVGVK